MNNDYILIDCGLIHKYCIKRNDIKIIEDTTLYTVKVLKDLSSYKVKLMNNKKIFSNKSEKLTFNKMKSSSVLKWALDEYNF